MSSFKRNENIHKKEDGPYYVVLAKKALSVTCNDPATKARGNIPQFCKFQIGVDSNTIMNQNGVQTITKPV